MGEVSLAIEAALESASFVGERPLECSVDLDGTGCGRVGEAGLRFPAIAAVLGCMSPFAFTALQPSHALPYQGTDCTATSASTHHKGKLDLVRDRSRSYCSLESTSKEPHVS